MMNTGWMCGVVCCAFVGACAGSSSETPPPIEPDFRRLRTAAPADRAAAPKDSADGGSEIEDLDDDPPPPPVTWGSGKPAQKKK